MKIYIPNKVMVWLPDEVPEQLRGINAAGYIPVFTTLQDLQMAYPGADYFERDIKSMNDENIDISNSD